MIKKEELGRKLSIATTEKRRRVKRKEKKKLKKRVTKNN
jgi:hypothetical protein